MSELVVEEEVEERGGYGLPELPEGWEWTTLGEICDKPKYGWTTRAAESGSVRLLRTTDITRGSIDWSKVPWCGEAPAKLQEFKVSRDDVLISRAGSVGYSALIEEEPPEDAVFASYLIRFRPSDSINVRFLSHFLSSPLYWRAIGASAVGVALKNVNATKLSQIPVPLPPLESQERIATQIDARLGEISALETELDVAEKLQTQFRQALLRDAFTGRLTRGEELPDPAEMDEKGRPVLPAGWEWKKLGEIASCQLGKMLDKAKNKGQLSAYIGNINVRWGRIDLSELKEMRFTHNEREKFSLRTDDVIVCEGGEPGRAALWTSPRQDVYFQKALHRVRAKNELMPAYLVRYLEYASGTPAFSNLLTGTTIKHLPSQKLKILEVPLPPVSEQQRITDDLTSSIESAESLLREIDAVRSQIEAARASLLHQAFTGQLVA